MTDLKADAAGGQLNALRAFALAVINTHPDVSKLLDEFIKLEEIAIALGTGSTVSEQYLESMRDVSNDLKLQMVTRLKTQLSAAERLLGLGSR